ncbi:MAG TPA: HAD family hydrolase [Chromatiales bacterium]|nr:HAD family hydrolase [Chromatiales bacterium]
MNRPRFDLITFDLDDTLWPCLPVIMAAEQRLFEWLQQQIPGIENDHTIDSLREERRRLMAARPEIAHDLTLVRRLALEQLFERYGVDPAKVDEGIMLFLEHRNRVQLYEDVHPVLGTLRETYTLISITNGNADVERIGVQALFHNSLTAAEVGAARPKPALFEQALELADAEPIRALHVGDDPVRDVEAARRLGMATVWMDRNDTPWPEELAPADHRVTDLFELRTWLSDQERVNTV